MGTSMEGEQMKLEDELKELKETRLSALVTRRRQQRLRCARVLEARTRVNLLRRSLVESGRALQQDMDQLERLEQTNQRREERLSRVRGKDLKTRERAAEVEFRETCQVLRQYVDELRSVRQQFITRALECVFPVEVVSLSCEDAGKDDYPTVTEIDCDSLMEVEEVTASLRVDGDHSQYLSASKERRKSQKKMVHTGVPSSTLPREPLSDTCLSTAAALMYTAQFVELISVALAVRLPHLQPRHVVISDYGNTNRKKKEFLDSVAKLDDNIVYLCFTQNVPTTALEPGHTLKNLLALVTHTQLGRHGPYTCDPTFLRYSAQEVGGADSEEPPTLIHSGYHGNCESESDEGDWEAVEGPPPEMAVPRHLDYNSTYLDYMRMETSEQVDNPHLAQTTGLLDTLSSLWSSTFSRTT